MAEAQFFSVKKLTTKLRDATTNQGIDDGFVAAAPIRFIADNRMFQPGQVYANLMCATGLQFDVQKSEAIESLPDSVEA